ncbi:long-chain-fatty acid--ACP ligase MbtM [Frankia sp. CNm7]|nr:long-chain-fatty acid--ACP ligase MbtM [Frankia nepalensis]MBL7514416.1 long-chain-fatty acid--ACP ligase MbtM [Frankia nepalensis]MBL7518360.1 long-chain-fatty acid--ACP ligase MbtM [Frankia nepalensis]
MARTNGKFDESASPSVLATAISRAMRAGDGTLSVLDAASGEWDTRPWREVQARAEQIAAQILAESEGREPRAVGLIGHPTVDLVAAIQGAWLAGVAVSVLPGPVRGADEQRWAQSTYARFVAIGVGTVLGSDKQLAMLANVDGPLRTAPVELYGRDADLTGFVGRQVGPDAPAVLQGTAGSTGEPKTAVLSVAAVHSNIRELVARLDVRPTRDVQLSWLPLYHDMGLIVVLVGMATGAPLWIAPSSAFVAAPFKWLQWLTESRATITAAPNFAYDIVGRYGRRVEGADLSRLRFAVSGAEPIDADAFDAFLDVAAKFGMDRGAAAPAYGMAESTCAVTMPDAGEGAQYDEVTVTSPENGGNPVRRRYAILGRPLGGMQIRIVEANGVDVPRIDNRDVGHVEIRGTSMMTGYLGHAPLADGEWFPTGDLGYLVDGRPVICGRAKEIIIVSGRNLFPMEIEKRAASVAGVRGGRVAAVARDGASGRPGLVIVAEFRGGDPESARRKVIAAVASECGVVPADVVFVRPGALPLTTSGKLRRLETRKLLESGHWNER